MTTEYLVTRLRTLARYETGVLHSTLVEAADFIEKSLDIDFHDVPHARTGAPDTSHEAVPKNLSDQALRVLLTYRAGRPMLDHDAYRHAGLTTEMNGARCRCSDLRKFKLIERCGRGITPSGKAGYLCRITDKGIAYIASREPKA